MQARRKIPQNRRHFQCCFIGREIPIFVMTIGSWIVEVGRRGLPSIQVVDISSEGILTAGEDITYRLHLTDNSIGHFFPNWLVCDDET